MFHFLKKLLASDSGQHWKFYRHKSMSKRISLVKLKKIGCCSFKAFKFIYYQKPKLPLYTYLYLIRVKNKKRVSRSLSCRWIQFGTYTLLFITKLKSLIYTLSYEVYVRDARLYNKSKIQLFINVVLPFNLNFIISQSHHELIIFTMYSDDDMTTK